MDGSGITLTAGKGQLSLFLRKYRRTAGKKRWPS